MDMERLPLRGFLHLFPLPAAVIDGSLQLLAHSRSLFAIFGLRTHRSRQDPAAQFGQFVAADEELGDQLALVTARLTEPGEEAHFTWKRSGRSYVVTACCLEAAGNVLLVIFEDTTSQAFSEELLRNARSYLEQILDGISLGVIVLNPELRITAINRRQLDFLACLGIELSLVETIGANLGEVLPEELGRAWQELCQKVLEGSEASAEAKEYPVADGLLALAASATPLRDQQGGLAGAILVCEDVTEKMGLERELIRVEKLATIGQMVVTINHEINNPLSIISTSAQMLRLRYPELDEKIVAKLRTIEDQVKRIAAVTERLRQMDAVVTSEYIESGPGMIDVWGKPDGE